MKDAPCGYGSSGGIPVEVQEHQENRFGCGSGVPKSTVGPFRRCKRLIKETLTTEVNLLRTPNFHCQQQASSHVSAVHLLAQGTV